MAERKKDESAFDIIAKGMTSFIKAKTSQAQAKLKMQSALKLKDIERKQNFMWKIAEKEHIDPMQRGMAQIWQRQHPGYGDIFGLGKREITPLTTPSTTPPSETRMPSIPFGGDVQKYMGSRQPTLKGGKFAMETPGTREVYNYLQKKKRVSETNPKIKFDEDDEEMLQSLGQKLGFETKEKAPTTAQRKILGEVRALKGKNATVEDIQEHIRFGGYEIEDFAEELEGYVPETKQGFWPWQK